MVPGPSVRFRMENKPFMRSALYAIVLNPKPGLSPAAAGRPLPSSLMTRSIRAPEAVATIEIWRAPPC